MLEFVFFSKDCFKLMYVGLFATGFINSILAAMIAYSTTMKVFYKVSIILFIATVILLGKFYKSIVIALRSDVTLYDWILRDTPEIETKNLGEKVYEHETEVNEDV